MKKVFKLILLIFLIASMITPAYVTAAERKIGSADTFEEAQKQITIWEPDSDFVARAIQGNPIPELPPITILQGGKKIKGTFTYPGYDYNTLGLREVTWVFTPIDTTIDPVSGTVKVDVIVPYSEGTEAPTAPSLTATSVSLNTMTAYDINLNDKVSGSSYLWTSSDPGVAEVNSRSGLLKAKSEGKTTVTCEITFPDQTKQTLISEVTVGYDENATLLTETQLDLNPGNAFDINLENKVAHSKYRWVSSDRSIITVNSANGVVTAKAAGTAYVTCTITTPDKQVIVLRCDINVTAPATITE